MLLSPCLQSYVTSKGGIERKEVMVWSFEETIVDIGKDQL